MTGVDEHDRWLGWLVRSQYGFNWHQHPDHPPVPVRAYAARYLRAYGDPSRETVDDYVNALAAECGWTEN